MVQYDFPFDNAFTANPLQQVINMTLAANSTAAVLGAPIMISNQASPSSCLAWSNSTLYRLINGLTGSSYRYVLCTYFPNSWLAVPDDGWNIQPPLYTTGPVPLCAVPDYMGPDIGQSSDWWVERYGLSGTHLQSVGRLVITHGSHDLTYGDGLPMIPLSSDPNDARVVYLEGCSHAEDFYSYSFMPKGLRTVTDDVSVPWCEAVSTSTFKLTMFNDRFETRSFKS
jgi:hypothetical protein